MKCLYCDGDIIGRRATARFCSDKHKDAHHNQEKQVGIRLVEKNMVKVQALAESHDVSIHEMVNIILNQVLDVSGQPLNEKDIYG